MSSDNEKVSVLMGIYNIPSKAILEQSIISILNQTYKNIEFIIVDDGSTNETYKWAQEIVKNDSRVKLIRNKKNIGLTKTLNIALKQATGKYIARMDGDDYCTLNKIDKQLAFLKKHPEYKLVSCNTYTVDENGIWGERFYKEIITKNDFLFTSPVLHPAILTYYDCYKKVNGYRESKETERAEDYDLFMRMFSQGVKMYTLQESLYYYREDSTCYKKRQYKYRFGEFLVRLKGFKLLHLYPRCIPYIFKPLIVGLIPQKILRKMRKNYNRIR